MTTTWNHCPTMCIQGQRVSTDVRKIYKKQSDYKNTSKYKHDILPYDYPVYIFAKKLSNTHGLRRILHCHACYHEPTS